MSSPLRPTQLPSRMQQYFDDLRAYDLAVAEWLGLNPELVMHLDEQEIKHPTEHGFAAPPTLKLTWQALDQHQLAATGPGREPLPLAARGGFDDPTVFTLGVHLGWDEVARLRAEVGHRPAFPMSVQDRVALERLAATATRGS